VTQYFFGPAEGIDSNDYIFEMQGPTGVTSKPGPIVGHSLTSPNQEIADALQATTVELKGGRIVQVRRTKRAAREIGRTYTIGYPSGALMSALKLRAIRGQPTTLFQKYACPPDPRYAHTHILPDATLNPPVEAEDPITNGEDTNFVTEQSEAQVSEKLTAWALAWQKTVTLVGSATTVLLDVGILGEECSDGGFIGNESMIAVGGNATDKGYVARTPDLWGSSTSSLTVAATAGDFIHALFAQGDLAVISETAGVAAALTATAGVIRNSVNRGVTWIQSTGITAPIYGLAEFGDLIVGVGKGGTFASAGPSGMWISSNRGNTFTEVLSTALRIANVILVDVAYDEPSGRLYVVGTLSSSSDAVVLVATQFGGAVQVIDISANIASLNAAGLNAVAILAKDHVAVGGPSGFYAESTNAGATWSQINVGTTDAIGGIAGNIYRTVVGAGTRLFRRDPNDDMEWKVVALENGSTLTGNVNRVRMGQDGDFNFFVAVTSVGEVVTASPYWSGLYD